MLVGVNRRGFPDRHRPCRHAPSRQRQNIADGNDNQVGGTSDSAANTIAYNADDGVAVTSNDNDDLTHKKVNIDDLGIDLGADRGTPNDTLDADTGANGLQNHPVIGSATVSSARSSGISTASRTRRTGSTSTPTRAATPPAAARARPTSARTSRPTTVDGRWPASGTETFTPATPLAAGQVVTMTATEQLASGKLRSTSEF